jgi:hypothetical protein
MNNRLPFFPAMVRNTAGVCARLHKPQRSPHRPDIRDRLVQHW